MSGRPHYYDTAMEATISTKISQEENEELNRLVRVSGVSKSDIIRSALTIILKHVRESYAVSKDVQKLLNEKRFSIQADRKSTRLNSSHVRTSRMPSSA